MQTEPVKWVVEEHHEGQRSLVLQKLTYTERSLAADVNSLRTWFTLQLHFPQEDVDERWLESMIIGSKSVEQAKKKLEAYYTVKNVHKEVFLDMDPLNLKCIQETQLYALPGLTAEGNAVFGWNIRAPQADNYHHLSAVRRIFLSTTITLRQGLLMSGVIVLMDMKNFTAAVFPSWKLSLFRVDCQLYQDVLPLRVKKVLVVNSHPVLVKFYNTLVKPVLKKKLADRVVLLVKNDLHKIKEYLPEDHIPEDLGGKAPSIEKLSSDMIEALRGRFREDCLKEERLRSDETKRPKGKSKLRDLVSDFRSLAID